MGTIGQRQFRSDLDDKKTDNYGSGMLKQTPNIKYHGSLKAAKNQRHRHDIHVKVVRGLIPQSRGGPPCPTVEKLNVMDPNTELLKRMENQLTEKRN